MKTAKGIALILILAASSLLWIKSASTQSIPKPSVPEVTIKIVDHSYDTPGADPTYTTDPYTGSLKLLSPGYPSNHVEIKSVDFTIKNQPFTPYNDSAGHSIGLYYNFRFKGHYGTEWSYDPFNPDGESSHSYGGWDMTTLIPYTPSNSEYTTVSMNLGESGIPSYGEADFQVQAQIGYIQAEGNGLMARVYGIGYNFTGQSSDWSSIQTLDLSDGQAVISPSVSPSPFEHTTASPTGESTQTPEQTTNPPENEADILPGFTWKDIALAAFLVIVAVLAAALVLLRRKRA